VKDKLEEALEIARKYTQKQEEELTRPEPSYYQKQIEKERTETSSWSGASFGGGTFAGRSRH